MLRHPSSLPNNWHRCIVFIAILTGVFIFHKYFYQNNEAVEPVPVSDNNVNHIRSNNIQLDKIFNCLTKKFENGTTFFAALAWLNLREAVLECRKPAEKSVIPEMFFGDEPKFFIPGPTPDFNYTMITLGVGRNIDAELKILNKYPGCTNYVGVDPTPDVNKDLLTAAGGQYLQRTVGATDGVFSAYIMGKSSYTSIDNVPHTSLQTVIKEANMTEVVDLMMMDIEGAEFEILESFIDQPANDTAICQLNVEIHNPWTNVVRQSNIIDILYKLSEKRKLLLFNVEVIKVKRSVFNRCFFINVENPYCVQKYYPAFR